MIDLKINKWVIFTRFKWEKFLIIQLRGLSVKPRHYVYILFW